jgi:23S rRNA (adenine2503-C2)-methyltransferase
MTCLQSLTQAELAELLEPVATDARKPEARARYRAKQIFHWVYQRFADDWGQMTDLSKELRQWLAGNVSILRLAERQRQQGADGTCKFLWELADGKTVESVLIPAAIQEQSEFSADDSGFSGRATAAGLDSEHWRRLTLCISTQIGCPMGCEFCLTGIQGLDRNLSAGEIVSQVLEARRLAPVSNVVLMGMGEPLNNLENVVRACRILIDSDGLGLSKRKVTVSTSGLVPAIEELGRQVDVSLAVSLNATTDEQRSRIMPVNRKWKIAELLGACRRYPVGSHRRISFEYVLLAGFNDSREDAERLVKLLRGIPSKINLIPFNEHPGSEYRRPSDETIRLFQKVLVDRKLTATVRVSRGSDILAACGQLRSLIGTATGTERHRDWPTGRRPR